MTVERPRVLSLSRALDRIEDRYAPRLLAELNGQHVKVVKLEGPFVWHQHAEQDELFLVIEGSLRIELRDGELALGPGELVVIPRGVEHRPVADAGVCSVLLFEPAGTINTGDADDPRRVDRLERADGE